MSKSKNEEKIMKCPTVALMYKQAIKAVNRMEGSGCFSSEYFTLLTDQLVSENLKGNIK